MTGEEISKTAQEDTQLLLGKVSKILSDYIESEDGMTNFDKRVVCGRVINCLNMITCRDLAVLLKRCSDSSREGGLK